MNSTTTIKPPASRRWLSVLLGFLIFFAGIAAGAGGAVVFAVGTLQYILHHPENAPARITSFLTRQLKLSDAQKQQVLAIVTRHHEKIQELRRQVRPQIDEQFDQARAEIDAVLTIDQRVKWETLFDRLREKWTPTLEPAPATQPQ